MNLVERVKNILVSPKTEWQVIKNETLSVQDMFMKYVMILAAIPAVAGFIGYSLIGVSVLGFTVRYPLGTGLLWAVLTYALNVAGVYLFAFIIDALGPSFGAAKNMNASLKLAVFASTASWLAGIFAIIPALAILAIVGLYGLYVLYVGMPIMKEVPHDKLVGYFIVSLVVSVVIYFIIGLIVGAIALGGAAAMGGVRGF